MKPNRPGLNLFGIGFDINDRAARLREMRRRWGRRPLPPGLPPPPPDLTQEEWELLHKSVLTEEEEKAQATKRRHRNARALMNWEIEHNGFEPVAVYSVREPGELEEAIRRELIRSGVTAKNTLDAYMGQVKRFGVWRRSRIKGNRAAPARIDNWLDMLRGKVAAGELKASSFNQALSAMKAVVRACEKWIKDEGDGDGGGGPFGGKEGKEAWAQQMLLVLGMKWEKVSRWKYRQGKWLSVENLEKLLNGVDTSELIGRRDLAMLALVFGLGLRRHEVVKVRRDMFSSGSGRVMLQGLVRKGKKVQDLPVSDWVWKCVEGWCVRAGIGSGVVVARLDAVGDGWVVVKQEKGKEKGEPVGISERWVRVRLRELCERAGVEVVNPHDGRRTFGKVYLDKGGNIEQLRIAYGHELLRTTQVYVNSGMEVGKGKAVVDLVGDAVNLAKGGD